MFSWYYSKENISHSQSMKVEQSNYIFSQFALLCMISGAGYKYVVSKWQPGHKSQLLT